MLGSETSHRRNLADCASAADGNALVVSTAPVALKKLRRFNVEILAFVTMRPLYCEPIRSRRSSMVMRCSATCTVRQRDAYILHHACILMVEDVAVYYKISDVAPILCTHVNSVIRPDKERILPNAL